MRVTGLRKTGRDSIALYDVLECTHNPMPPKTKAMPIHVSVACQLRIHPGSHIRLTSAYNLLLCPPLSQDCKQKCQRVCNRYSETQFRLPYQDEEPYTARDIEQQRHGICGSTQNAYHGVEHPEDLLLEPGVVWVGKRGAGRWGVVPECKLVSCGVWSQKIVGCRPEEDMSKSPGCLTSQLCA
jgi:hypothetical protein